MASALCCRAKLLLDLRHVSEGSSEGSIETGVPFITHNLSDQQTEGDELSLDTPCQVPLVPCNHRRSPGTGDILGMLGRSPSWDDVDVEKKSQSVERLVHRRGV